MPERTALATCFRRKEARFILGDAKRLEQNITKKSKSTVEQRKRNLGHMKRLKTEKDTLERKEGNLCLVAVARRKLSHEPYLSWFTVGIPVTHMRRS